MVLADSFNGYLDSLHLSEERIEEHINHFVISPESIEATLEWLDKGIPGGGAVSGVVECEGCSSDDLKYYR